jgi:stress-induced-phosphoprotein 1
MSDKNPEAEAKKAEGNTAFAANDYDTAIQKYTEAAEIDSSNHVYYSNRSAVYLAKEDWVSAEKDATKCVELNDVFVKGYFRLARAEMEQGKLDEAIATIRKGLKKNEGNPELGNLLRKCKALKNPTQKAPRKGGPSEEAVEAHQKYQKARREVMTLEAQIQSIVRDTKRTKITQEQLGELPDGTSSFRTVGKMFLSAPPDEIKGFLNEACEKDAAKVEELQKKKAYFERRAASLEADLKDLMK